MTTDYQIVERVTVGGDIEVKINASPSVDT